MSGRGAGDRPLTYAGAYDAARTYLARQVVTSGGSAYMAVAKTAGHAPPNTTYWLPLGGGGGGGGAALLGVAGIFTDFDSVTSNGVRIHLAANADFDVEFGDHGMAVGPDIIYNAGGDKDGYYQATITFFISHVTNGVSSDINQLMWEDAFFGKVPIVFATTPAGASTLVPTASAGLAVTAELDIEPRLSAWCSGGTDRVYGWSAYITVARWALP